MKKFLFPFSLTLFDEGGGEGTGAEGQALVAGEQSGEVSEEQADAENGSAEIDREAEFDRLVKGEYKNFFDKKVQGIINKRFKSSKMMEERLNKNQSVFDVLGQRYGVDASDPDAILNAVENDQDYLESKAMEQGVTVEQYKEMQQTKRELANYKRDAERRQQNEKMNAQINNWRQQGEELKKFYPNFDLGRELEDEGFFRLVSSGLPVKTAYQAIHTDEIIGGAMKYASEQGAKKTANAVRANSRRPSEGALGAQTGRAGHVDVNKMTKEQREELEKQAMRGAKIIL